MDQLEIATNFYFKLSLDGDEANFQEVSGLNPDMAVTDVSKYANLVLKRGFLLPSVQLVGWVKQVLEGGFQKAIQTHDLQLSLMDADEAVLAIWTVYEALPVKWSVSAFKNGEANELAIETLEFSYARIVKIA